MLTTLGPENRIWFRLRPASLRRTGLLALLEDVDGRGAKKNDSAAGTTDTRQHINHLLGLVNADAQPFRKLFKRPVWRTVRTVEAAPPNSFSRAEKQHLRVSRPFGAIQDPLVVQWRPAAVGLPQNSHLGVGEAELLNDELGEVACHLPLRLVARIPRSNQLSVPVVTGPAIRESAVAQAPAVAAMRRLDFPVDVRRGQTGEPSEVGKPPKAVTLAFHEAAFRR